jgi:hypothetical protein
MVYLYMASIFNISMNVFRITEKHKKLLQPNQLKKRWDGLLLHLVYAGFGKKNKEERALERHYLCFRSSSN